MIDRVLRRIGHEIGRSAAKLVDLREISQIQRGIRDDDKIGQVHAARNSSAHRAGPLSADASVAISDAVAELSAASATLGKALHPHTAANLADLVRIMNTYYSNLIEGHHTRPRDIQARACQESSTRTRAARGFRDRGGCTCAPAGAEIDRRAAAGKLDEPAPSANSSAGCTRNSPRMPPGNFCSSAAQRSRVSHGARGLGAPSPEHDNAVGRHLPPSSARVADFMDYFAHALSVRGARKSRAHYGGRRRASPLQLHPSVPGRQRARQPADEPRHGAFRRNRRAWSLVDFARLVARAGTRTRRARRVQDDDECRRHAAPGRSRWARQSFAQGARRVCAVVPEGLPGSGDVHVGAVRHRAPWRSACEFASSATSGSSPKRPACWKRRWCAAMFERGDVGRITGLPERSARRILSSVIEAGLLAIRHREGPVSLRFPDDALEILFPRLYPEAETSR